MKARTLKIRTLIAMPLVAALGLLGACTTDKPAPEPTVVKTASVPDIPTQNLNEQPREALQAGGELRVGVNAFPANWNPLSRASVGSDLGQLNRALFPTFFNIEADGSAVANPDFLLSADVTNESPTTVTLKLNPEAVWGDGDPITVNDITATYKACTRQIKKVSCASSAGFDQIASIAQGADASEAVVTYTSSNADWTLPFATVGTLRADSVADADAFNKGWDTIKPEWTSGAFVPGGIDSDDQAFAVVPNPKWWGDEPLLDRITFLARPSGERVEQFGDSRLDAFSVVNSPASVDQLPAESNAEVRTGAGPQVRMLAMNSAGALEDPKVRQAVAFSLNREEIATAATQGLNWPALVVNNHLFALNQLGYVDEAEATDLVPDAESARATLANSVLQLQIAVLKGAETPQESSASPAPSPSESTGVTEPAQDVPRIEAEAIKAQLEEAGVRVRITEVDNLSNALTSDAYDLVVLDQGPTAYPLSLTSRYGAKQASNFFGSPPPEVVAAITALSENTDAEQRLGLADTVAAQMWRQTVNMPLYQRPQSVLVRKDLANYGAFGVQSVDWVNVGYLANPA